MLTLSAVADPVVLFFPGSLADARARRRFVRAVSEALELAERTGRRAELDRALDLLMSRLPDLDDLGHGIAIVASEDPVLTRVSHRPDGEARLEVRTGTVAEAPPGLIAA